MILHLDIDNTRSADSSAASRNRSWSNRMALPPGTRLTRRQYQYCVQWLDGSSYAQIARDFGVSRSSVCRVIRRAISNNPRLECAFGRRLLGD